jgi:hypothetical protein
MKTTTYKCDKCGAEDTTNEIDLKHVGVFVGNYERDFSSFVCNPEIQLTKEWCRDCRYKYGLIPTIEKSKVEVTHFTLEDMVREMISDENSGSYKKLSLFPVVGPGHQRPVEEVA